jgi:hypothetical protein
VVVWPHVQDADELGLVCPQVLPDSGREQFLIRKQYALLYEYLRRVDRIDSEHNFSTKNVKRFKFLITNLFLIIFF